MTLSESLCVLLFFLLFNNDLQAGSSDESFCDVAEGQIEHDKRVMLQEPGFVFTNRYMTFSPNFSEIWYLHTNKTQRIQLTIVQADLHQCCDLLVICNTSQSEQEHSNNNVVQGVYQYGYGETQTSHPVIRSYENRLVIHSHHMDMLRRPGGFMIWYIALGQTDQITCGTRLDVSTLKQQAVTVMNRDEPCRVTLQAPPRKRVYLQVIYLDLQPSPRCEKQHVNIYTVHFIKGHRTRRALLGQLCRGRALPIAVEYISTHTMLQVEVLADPGKTALIFNYKQYDEHSTHDVEPCDFPSYLEKMGRILKPAVYTKNLLHFRKDIFGYTPMQIFWLIVKTDPSDILLLNFTGMSMVMTPDCIKDRVTIRRGRCVTSSPVIGYFCGQTPEELFSQTDGLWTTVVLYSEINIPFYVRRVRFNMFYSVIPLTLPDDTTVPIKTAVTKGSQPFPSNLESTKLTFTLNHALSFVFLPVLFLCCAAVYWKHKKRQLQMQHQQGTFTFGHQGEQYELTSRSTGIRESHGRNIQSLDSSPHPMSRITVYPIMTMSGNLNRSPPTGLQSGRDHTLIQAPPAYSTLVSGETTTRTSPKPPPAYQEVISTDSPPAHQPGTEPTEAPPAYEQAVRGDNSNRDSPPPGYRPTYMTTEV